MLQTPEAVPLTSETPLRPIPLGLAPPFESEKWYGLQVSLSVSEEFTDNADQTKENRKSEFRTYVTPAVSFRMNRPNGSLNFDYAPTFFFPDNRVEDTRFDQYLSLRGSWNPGTRFRIGIADNLTYSTDFLAVGDLGTLRTGTNPFLTNTGSVDIAYVPPEGRIGLSYTNILNQQYDVANPDNSMTHTVRLDGQLVNPRLTIGGGAWASRGLFDISSDYWEYNGEARASYLVIPELSATLYGLATYHDADRDVAVDYWIGRFRPGVLWTYAPTGSVEASVGVDVFAPSVSRFPGLLPLIVEVPDTTVQPSIFFRWSHGFRPVTISAQYSQSYQGNFTSIENTGVSFSRTAGVAVSTTGALFRDLSASLAFNWVQNEYQQTTLNVRRGTTDNTFNVDFSLRYYILRALSLTLGYVFTIRDSTNASDDFYENRFRVGLSYQYDIF